MKHPPANRQQPLLGEKVVELIDGGRVGSTLAVDEIDPHMERAALDGEKAFLLEQREELQGVGLGGIEGFGVATPAQPLPTRDTPECRPRTQVRGDHC